MKIVRRIAAVLTGMVLLIAGYLKILDPVGAGLVVTEYLKFFGVGFLEPAAMPVACFLALFEQITGIAMVAGIWRRVTACVSAVLLGFFTVLTAVLLVLNPNLDCGCFGEVIRLTHLQSFVKNVVLCGLWVLAYIPFGKMEEPNRIKYVGFSLASLVALLVGAYSVVNIPAIDHTPYSCGVRLYGSSSYNFEAPVLSFYNGAGEYSDSLAWDGDRIIVSIYDPDDIPEEGWARIRDFVDSMRGSRYGVLVLAGSVPGYFDYDAGCEVYYCDPGTLVTLNRSNGGAVLLEDGEICGKCAFWELPQKASDVESCIDMNIGGYVMAQGALLAILAFLLLL